MRQAEREANEALWAQRVADYPASGLSQPQGAAAQGVPWRRVKYWLPKWRPAAATDPGPTGIAGAGPDPATALTVRVGRAAMRGERDFDPQFLPAIVRALTSGSSAIPSARCLAPSGPPIGGNPSTVWPRWSSARVTGTPAAPRCWCCATATATSGKSWNGPTPALGSTTFGGSGGG